ncbi:hypothetical protein K3172_13010 [Qipengyuania sp. 6B39]|uniref:hypothetical protein n=1 Tax=Qipengyuania proteolytica TaxID=2867239 RepID=UPI001C8AED1D|nr:hypothetical protein [Qipengyuania proteolytica]MBX7496779.1 hypothetical protein [Qipengyuania proteolytica]
MNKIGETYWTDWLFGVTMPTSGWLGILGSFAGVLVAFSLGVWWARRQERGKDLRALRFLDENLRNCLERFAPFEVEFRPVAEQDDIERAFGALHQTAACVRWAVAHPERFEPALFLRLLMVEQRCVGATRLGPSDFTIARDGEIEVDRLEASTYLWREIHGVASDIRYVLSD